MNGNDAPRRPGPWELPGYVHDRELGAGASGRVVLARHEATGTPVAIKYLSQAVAGREAFRAEAALLGDLRSPYVAQLYEYVESGRGAAIVMELVDGVALRTLLQQEGATGPEAALVVLKGSLLGLAAAHAAGVVHRDYKPANVLVAADGSSKLVDFGVAVRSGDQGTISGTPAYMAPEQWAGQPASPAADVYAATVTFFECLTGAKPYGGTTLVELALQHTEAPIPDELAPDQVRPLIRKGLAKTPQGRPSSAAELVVELEAVAAAAYGEDWEERGQRKLAALVALLPLLLPSAGGGAGAGGTALATTVLGAGADAGYDLEPAGYAEGERFGGRNKLTAGITAAVLLTAAVGGIAVASELSSNGSSVVSGAGPVPVLTTIVTPGVAAAATSLPTLPVPSDSTSASASASASPSPSPSASASPSTVPSATVAAPPGPSAPGPTTAAGTPSQPSTPTGAPSTSAAPSPSSTLRVVRLAVGTPSCSGAYGISVPVTVVTTGTGTGELTLSWIDVNATGQVSSIATGTLALPLRGRGTSVSHFFGHADSATYWGLQVSGLSASGSNKIVSIRCNPPG
ncbi:hypothetical protein P3T36_002241 [Kitasatospora sp. MAP12-15]|uniref:serine/threonine-protein kinase n=1 Tax=unclassified Kitasatospora TaxID=2633591 RepID=UPI002472FF11|nr:serine/threonine-protein kinase [Kitasatospora sp. MAP12-44]MDH6108879.1 hypothetical protein [Kitasatospora sp. MAP12-44]